MVGPLSQFLAEIAAFLEAHAIQLVQIHIQWELRTKFVGSFKQANSHAESVIVLRWVFAHQTYIFMRKLEAFLGAQDSYTLCHGPGINKSCNISLHHPWKLV